MAAPAFGALGTASAGATSTSAVAAAPAGSTTGFVVCWFYIGGPAQVVTPPAGWVAVPFTAADATAVTAGTASVNASSANGHGQHGMYAWWARNPTGGSYAFTLAASNYHEGYAERLDGVGAGTPWDPNPTAAQGGASNSTISPAVATTSLGPDRLIIHAATNWAGGTWTPPTGYTKRFDSSSDKILTVSDVSQAVAGTTGSITATCAASDERTAWIGALVGTTAASSPGQFFPFFS